MGDQLSRLVRFSLAWQALIVHIQVGTEQAQPAIAEARDKHPLQLG
jgi:hypothetical protein